MKICTPSEAAIEIVGCMMNLDKAKGCNHITIIIALIVKNCVAYKLGRLTILPGKMSVRTQKMCSTFDDWKPEQNLHGI